MNQTKTHYIPAGRTALIVKGEFELQLQTEYSPRPIPRISSSVLCSGELLHRVDVPLDSLIDSHEDMATAERLIVLQHGEVLRIISADNFGLDSEFPYESLWLSLYPDTSPNATGRIDLDSQSGRTESGETRVSIRQGEADETGLRSGKKITNEDSSWLDPLAAGEMDIAALPANEKKALPSPDSLSWSGSVEAPASLNIREYREPNMSDSEKVRRLNRTTLERLYSIDGVEKILTVEWHGRFLTESAEKEFKQKFKSVYKKLDQALEVFPPLPGGLGREEGIYEVEIRRLYMVSHGAFVYFIIMRQMPFSQPIEEVIREALDS